MSSFSSLALTWCFNLQRPSSLAEVLTCACGSSSSRKIESLGGSCDLALVLALVLAILATYRKLGNANFRQPFIAR